MRGRSACTRAERTARRPAACRLPIACARIAPLIVALVVTLSPTTPCAVAQESDIEEIVVTGSRIARPDFESASPIVSIDEDFFRRSGSSTVESQLNTLPQLVPSFSSTSNNPSNGGQGNLDLRGLGPTSTLVLVDGKRLIPANGAGVVDVNIIPASLIESVEIITGGASAVYGSDALAGVVNLKLKHTLEGVQVDGTWGRTARGDGTQYDAGLTAGTDFAGGRGSIVGFVGYADRELLTQGDRDFSKYDLVYVGDGNGTLGPGDAFLPGGSGILEEGVVFFEPSQRAFEDLMTSYGYDVGNAAGQVPYQTGFGFNSDGTLFTQGHADYAGTQVLGVANFRGARDPVTFNDYVYSYNFAPPNALQLPLERNSAFVRAELELSDSARVYAQGLYSDYSATLQLAPTGLFAGVSIPVDNPYVPEDLELLLDSRPDPSADFVFYKRLSEIGPRVSRNTYDVYQLTLGLSGTLFSDWKYEAYAQRGANDQEDRQSGNVLRSLTEELTFAPDGGVSICGGFDPFGLGSISHECLDYIEVDASNHASVDQSIMEASLSGTPLALPAGDLEIAFGLFYKEEQYQYTAAPVATAYLADGLPDIQGFNAAGDIHGDDRNVDVWGEVLVPLLTDVPRAASLETVLGYRLSDYASAGGFDSWKAELIYEPVDVLRLRGSYQRATRAPSIYELYLPQLTATIFSVYFPDGVEPCDATSSARNGPDGERVETLCVETGVPAELLPGFYDADDSMSGVSGGNPDLGPEEAATQTLGMVWAPRFAHALVSNLQLSLDWYRIEIDDKIAQPFAEESIQFCYDARYNPRFSPTNLWCMTFGRDPITGEIEDFRQINWNAFTWETSGVDMQLDWRFDLGPGHVGVNWFLSWLDEFTISAVDSSAATDLEGFVGGFAYGLPPALPEWKFNLHLSYSWRELAVGAGWRYIDAMTDLNFPELRLPSVDYFSLDASYEFSSGPMEGLRFDLGVENLTDQDPPIFDSNSGANTEPSQYDVSGRRYFVRVRYTF